jgi:fungal STAND N-terminal Goodbye domain
MGDQSESTSFRALFESAFQAYEKKTGITLAEHPLAMQLQSCHSVESMTALVQDQASAFNEFRGKDRVTKSLKSTLSILIKLSATASLGSAVGLVCRKGPDGVSHWHL